MYIRVVAGVALVVALFVGVISIRTSPVSIAAQDLCKPGDVKVNTSIPADLATVKLRVVNGTNTPNLGSQVANDFRSRSFVVSEVTSEASTDELDKAIAVIRFGPQQVGNAWLIHAHFFGYSNLVFDPNYVLPEVTVVIGGKFKKLATPTERNQALGQLGRPVLPEGTCEA